MKKQCSDQKKQKPLIEAQRLRDKYLRGMERATATAKRCGEERDSLRAELAKATAAFERQADANTSLLRIKEGLSADKKLLIDEIESCRLCNQQLLADAEAYGHNQGIYKEWQRQKKAFESELADFRSEQKAWTSRHPKPTREHRVKRDKPKRRSRSVAGAGAAAFPVYLL